MGHEWPTVALTHLFKSVKAGIPNEKSKNSFTLLQ